METWNTQILARAYEAKTKKLSLRAFCALTSHPGHALGKGAVGTQGAEGNLVSVERKTIASQRGHTIGLS